MNNPETLTERLRRHSQTVDLAGYHAVATDVLEAADTIDTLTTRLREVEEARDDARERATFNARLADQRFREGAEIRSLLALAVADAEGPWDFAWLPAARQALSTERTPT